MRIKLYHILISLSLTFTGLSSVYAQDTGAPNYDYDPYTDRERERIIYSPGESDPNSNKPIIHNTAKDSSSMRMPVQQRNVKSAPEPAKNANKPKEDDDDSILSFNFLYYIIQKYKLQDIVD